MVIWLADGIVNQKGEDREDSSTRRTPWNCEKKKERKRKKEKKTKNNMIKHVSYEP